MYSITARGRKIRYSSYTSRQEKDMLLYCSDGTDEDIERALKICKISDADIEFMTLDERKALLYKLREISVGEALPARYVCPHCNSPVELEVNITGVFKEPQKTSKWIKDLGKAEFNVNECFVEGYGDLDYDKYLSLKKNISEYVETFDFDPEVKCLHCGKSTKLNIGSGKFIISNMSEESLMSLYKSYNALVYNGHYTMLDVDAMYPFERMIYFGQIKQRIDESNKSLKFAT